MTAEQARAILAQAKNDNSYEDPIPEEDGKAIDEAVALVKMAKTAWDAQIRGPQVEAILRIASEEFFPNGNGSTHEEPASEPEAKVEPEPQPQAEGSVALDSGTDDMKKVEPWDGYATDKVPDIVEGINIYVEGNDADLPELLAHIWAFETSHKNRKRIVSHLEEVAVKLGMGNATAEVEQPAPDEIPTPDPEPQPEEETPDSQPEDQPETPVEEPPAVETEEPPAEAESDYDERVRRSKEILAQREAEKAEAPETKVHHPEPRPQVQHADEVELMEPDKGDPDDLIQLVEDELRRERLTIPEPPAEELPEIPWDWTKVSLEEIQKLHGAYSNAAFYKNFQLQREERLARHYKDQADETHRELLVASAKYDEKGKEKKVTVLEAEIENTDGVKIPRRRQRLHEIYATAARQERDSYNKLVESLSRLHTMRKDEWEMSGNKR